jgi:DNA-directed RNA polymerase subunit RPC12/RpoP
MFQGIFGFIMLMFVLVFAAVAVGMIWHARMAGKIFTLAERHLDEQLSRPISQTADESRPEKRQVECTHCGSKVAPAAKCPNCGAQLA